MVIWSVPSFIVPLDFKRKEDELEKEMTDKNAELIRISEEIENIRK